MTDLSDEDAVLLLSYEHCDHLAWHGVTAMRAEPFGVALEKRRRIVGLWSYYRGQYRYRSLASWEPIATVATLDMAVEPRYRASRCRRAPRRLQTGARSALALATIGRTE